VVHTGAQAAGGGVERGAAERLGAAAGAREGADVAAVVVVGVTDGRVGAAIVEGGVGGVQDLPASLSTREHPHAVWLQQYNRRSQAGDRAEHGHSLPLFSLALSLPLPLGEGRGRRGVGREKGGG
jgi:hypothetical protein